MEKSLARSVRHSESCVDNLQPVFEKFLLALKACSSELDDFVLSASAIVSIEEGANDSQKVTERDLSSLIERAASKLASFAAWLPPLLEDIPCRLSIPPHILSAAP